MDDFKTQISLLFKSRRVPASVEAITLLNRIIQALHERVLMVISEMRRFDMDIIIDSVFSDDIKENLHRVHKHWDKFLHFQVPVYTELNVIYEYLITDIIDRTIYDEVVCAKNIKSVFERDIGLYKLLRENRIVLLDAPEDCSMDEFANGLKGYVNENPHVF